MKDVTASRFGYLAFDDNSWVLLGHGATAAEALMRADRAAPDAALYVIEAGTLGEDIWTQGLDLPGARSALAAQARWRAGRNQVLPHRHLALTSR